MTEISQSDNPLDVGSSPTNSSVMQESSPVSWWESFVTWSRVAALSFGGPAGQIAVMHRIIVDEKKWITEDRFLHALNYCMLLPGPEAQQLATYIGWLMHRTRGGLLAGGLFILPGFFSILILSILYAEFHQVGLVQGLFFGLKPAIVAIVIEAVIRIGKRVLKNQTMLTIAIASFVALFFFTVPFPVLIISAGLVGFLGGRLAPSQFVVVKGHGQGNSATVEAPIIERIRPLDDVHPSWSRAFRVSAVCLTLWFAPLILIHELLGEDSVYWKEGVFFSEAAVVTFGGAYAVLAYIAQAGVETYHWLQPGEMLDGLGMAETTPGPLIMVVQFVGFLGAYRDPGPVGPLWGGILGSILTTWVTFVPCFYWIFLGAPSVERLRGNPLLTAALSSITAAVVGAVLNLAIWFAMHTVFSEVETVHFQGMRFLVPEWNSLNLAATGIAILACLMTFLWKRGMVTTLLVSVALGIVWTLRITPQ